MEATEVALAALIIGLFAWLRSGLPGVRADMRDSGRRLEDRRLALEAHLSGLLNGLGLAARVRAELPDSKPPAGLRMDGHSDPPRLDGDMPDWTLLRPRRAGSSP